MDNKEVYISLTQEQLRTKAVEIKDNAKTKWVMLPNGAVIKRHKDKHFNPKVTLSLWQKIWRYIKRVIDKI